MRTEGCDVRTWATFTDISLYGCYIEAQATFPAGTVLNLKLEANGIRVETRGNVRVNYPYLGMGVAFVGMTGRKCRVFVADPGKRIKRLCGYADGHQVYGGRSGGGEWHARYRGSLRHDSRADGVL